MKIEFKKKSFDTLVKWMQQQWTPTKAINEIYNNEILPQYEKQFKTYNEPQKFKVGQFVRIAGGGFNGDIGRVSKVIKRPSGRYFYKVKWYESKRGTLSEFTSNALTEKNFTLVHKTTNERGNTVFI